MIYEQVNNRYSAFKRILINFFRIIFKKLSESLFERSYLFGSIKCDNTNIEKEKDLILIPCLITIS